MPGAACPPCPGRSAPDPSHRAVSSDRPRPRAPAAPRLVPTRATREPARRPRRNSDRRADHRSRHGFFGGYSNDRAERVGLDPPSRGGPCRCRPATPRRADNKQVGTQSGREWNHSLGCLTSNQDPSCGCPFGPREAARVEQQVAGERVVELTHGRQRRREPPDPVLDGGNDVQDRQLGLERARQLSSDLGRVTRGARAR